MISLPFRSIARYHWLSFMEKITVYVYGTIEISTMNIKKFNDDPDVVCLHYDCRGLIFLKVGRIGFD